MQRILEFLIYVILLPLLCGVGGFALLYLILYPFSN